MAKLPRHLYVAQMRIKFRCHIQIPLDLLLACTNLDGWEATRSASRQPRHWKATRHCCDWPNAKRCVNWPRTATRGCTSVSTESV